MQLPSVRRAAPARACWPACRARGAFAAAFILATSLTQAAPAPPLPALLKQAQASAPLLLEQQANVRAASADLRQAGAWLNPTLSANAENLGAPLAGGVTQRQDTYTITQVVETGGKRTMRIAAEQRKLIAAQAVERQNRLGFANTLALAYAAAEAMQQKQQLAGADLARANDDLRAAEALVKAGREAELRLVQARASSAAAQAALEGARAGTIDALEKLSALVGASDVFTGIEHSILSSLPAPRPRAAWTAADAPALATASAEHDALAAQVGVERKRAMPDLGVTLGMRRFGWSSEPAATVGLSATIPLFDRNQAGIDAARERASSAALRLQAARLDVVAAHRSALAQMQASERILQAAELGEAASVEAYRLGRLGYDAGKTALLELLAIRRALAEAQSLTIEARLARVRALVALSLAEGRNVFGEAP